MRNSASIPMQQCTGISLPNDTLIVKTKRSTLGFRVDHDAVSFLYSYLITAMRVHGLVLDLKLVPFHVVNLLRSREKPYIMSRVHRMDLKRFDKITRITPTSTCMEIFREAFYRRISIGKRGVKSLREEMTSQQGDQEDTDTAPANKSETLESKSETSPSVQDEDKKVSSDEDECDADDGERLMSKSVCSEIIEPAVEVVEKIERGGLKKKSKQRCTKSRDSDGESNCVVLDGNSTTDDGQQSNSGLHDRKRKGQPPDS